MNSKIFEGIVSDLQAIVIPGVKRGLRIMIKDRAQKENNSTVMEDLAELKGHYMGQLAMIFAGIEKESMIKGITDYSGYQEPKEDE